MSILSSTGTGLVSHQIDDELLTNLGYEVFVEKNGREHATNEKFICNLQNFNDSSGWFTIVNNTWDVASPGYDRERYKVFLKTGGDILRFEKYWELLYSRIRPEAIEEYFNALKKAYENATNGLVKVML